MARTVEPRVIDFTYVRTPQEEAKDNEEYQAILTAIRGGRPGLTPPGECKGALTFTMQKDGRLKAHTRTVPAHRMRRARRILWECQQHPDWPHKPSMFYRHPSLKNVPYGVLKQLVKESEER